SNSISFCIKKSGVRMILGKCPYCDDGNIEVKEKEVRGKKVKLYVCTNAAWTTQDGEMFELTPDATCDFRIWQNSLAKYGKWLTYKEVRTLLEEKVLEVELLSKKYGKKIYYEKNIILSQEYGVSVLWE
ncbi:MAG: hypothetical protein WBK95_06115, partial [Sulfurimonas sp.]